MEPALEAPVRHNHDIFTLDSGYVMPGYDAIHLLLSEGRAAFVDTGTHHSLPAMLAALDRLCIPRDKVDYVILTHVHLDHAGGAGSLMRELPAARLVVHPRGARHMAAPEKLFAAVCEVYGDAEARRMYGELLPIPTDRIIEAKDGTTLRLGARELKLFDTPGHAKHHLVIHDSQSGNVFSGDTFGLSYRQLDAGGRHFVYPTTSPSQFDPAALHRSVDLIAGLKPDAVYVTHYSEARDVQRLAADMHRLIDAQIEIALREQNAGTEREARIHAGLRELVCREAAAQGWARQGEAALHLLAMDLALNAQGLCIWLDSQKPGASA